LYIVVVGLGLVRLVCSDLVRRMPSLFLPRLFWRNALDPSGRIWRLLVVLRLVVTLLRLEPDAVGGGATSYSVNKVRSCAELGFLQTILLLSLAGLGGEGRRGDAAVLEAEAWRRRGRSAAPESYAALFLGGHQQRTGDDGVLRLASASYGRMATLLDLASMVVLPPGYMPTWRIFSSCCWAPSRGASPSGSSPVLASLAWWRSSSARCGGEGPRGPDCFFLCLLEGLDAIAEVLFVFSSFLLDLFVICTPTVDE